MKESGDGSGETEISLAETWLLAAKWYSEYNVFGVVYTVYTRTDPHCRRLSFVISSLLNSGGPLACILGARP